MVRERYSLQHQNVVEMIGLDSSFGTYPGLVLEYCENSSLDEVRLSQISAATWLYFWKVRSSCRWKRIQAYPLRELVYIIYLPI